MELFLRVVFSLLAVLGLMWFLARTASRRMGGANPSLVRLVGRQSLGRTASVAAIAVGERVLVVGVSESGVRLLTELDADEVDVPAAVAVASTATSAPDGDATLPALPAQPGTVQGSILSPQTWRQAWTAATSKSGAAS